MRLLVEIGRRLLSFQVELLYYASIALFSAAEDHAKIVLEHTVRNLICYAERTAHFCTGGDPGDH
ncbi:hypothetical protein, partial [Aestuariivita boseongensis]|uniref:hypothetical protein n=1 Tax=Aestuariivita boseongensis TaxID=1470562 RepID=UPI001C124CDA